jgi:hypothetical protein
MIVGTPLELTTGRFHNRDTVAHGLIVFVSTDNGATYDVAYQVPAGGFPANKDATFPAIFGLKPGESLWGSLTEATVTTESQFRVFYEDVALLP